VPSCCEPLQPQLLKPSPSCSALSSVGPWSPISSSTHSFDLGPLLLLMLYPLPIAVAALRKHNALLSIIVTNLWLGWTVIGWFVVLIWACNWDVEPAAE